MVEYRIHGTVEGAPLCHQAFLRPLCPLLYILEDTLFVKVINDTPKRKKVHAAVSLISFSGERREKREYDLTLQEKSVVKVEEIKGRRKDEFVYVTLESGSVREERFLLFNKPNEARIEESGLSVKSIEKKGERFTITLTSRRPSLFTLVDTKSIDGHFSDSYFALLPGEEKSITFKSREKGLLPSDLEKDLVLWDISRILTPTREEST